MLDDDRSAGGIDDIAIDDIRGGSRWYTMLLYYADGRNDDIAGGEGVILCARNDGDDSIVCLYLWCCLLFIIYYSFRGMLFTFNIATYFFL